MREFIWTWARSKHPAGCVLPGWLVAVRALLFPLDTAYWRLSQARGFQAETDTWLIDGTRWPSESLRAIANAKGEFYQITRSGQHISIDRVEVRPHVVISELINRIIDLEAKLTKAQCND